MKSSRRTSLWTAAAVVTVAGALLTLPRTDAGAGGPLLSMNLACYKAKTLRGFKFNKTDVQLIDALRFWNATVLKPELYCVPTTVDANATFFTGESVTCYRVKEAKGTSKLNDTDFSVKNAFGLQGLRLSKGKMVCVPNTSSSPLSH